MTVDNVGVLRAGVDDLEGGLDAGSVGRVVGVDDLAVVLD